MHRRSTLRFALTFAGLLALVGALAYVAPRPAAPAPLAALAGAWPTLWFAAALVLAGTARARGAPARRRAAGVWAAVALATEAVQHPTLAALLFPDGPGDVRFHPAAYAHLGTFDVLDVAAALVGATVGGVLAAALARTCEIGRSRAATERGRDLAGRGALLAVAAVATLATSPPPGPYVSVTIEPSVVCEGDEVRVAWTGHRGADDHPPDRGFLNAVPPDAFVPPLVDHAVAVPGTVDVVAARSGGIAADPTAHPSAYGAVSAIVHARPCDAAGHQYRREDGHTVVGLAAVPGGTDVVAALRSDDAFDRLVRLDADAQEVATAPVTGDRDGRVRDLAVAPDGTVVAVGWRSPTPADGTTEVVVWRWPVGAAPDDGTVLEPTDPEASADVAAIAVDDTGRAWVAWTEEPSGHTVANATRYAPDGTLEGTYAVPATGSTRSLAIAVDALGRPTMLVQVAGDGTTAPGRYLHALDVDGAPRWTHGPLHTNRAEIATGAPGTTYVLVEYALHALDDATGTTLWSTEFADDDTALRLTVDDAGAPVVAGLGPFLQRYAADGTPGSGRTFGSAHDDVVDALVWSGGAVVAGWTSGALATTLDPDGSSEAFVLRFPDGAP